MKERSLMKGLWQKAVLMMAVLVACVMMVPMSVAAGDVTSGTLGDNGGITWTYDESTKTLTVTGEDSGLKGDWVDYFIRSPFYSVAPDVEQVIMQECKFIGDASFLFAYLDSVKVIKFDNFDTSAITNMRGMFYHCYKLEQLDVSDFNTSQVTDMVYMFESCVALEELDVSGFNTSQVTEMRAMFLGCNSISELDVSGLDTSKVTSMRGMFSGCSVVAELDVSNFDTSQVTDMAYMFENCSNIVELDLGNFNIIEDCDVERMIKGCQGLEIIYTPESIKGNVSIDLPQLFYDEEGNSTYYITPYFCNKVLEVKGVFADVPRKAWYFPYVLKAYNNGYMAGTGTDAQGRVIFKPLANVTREQFVQILYNIEGTPAVQYQNIFPDVPEQSGSVWYSNAIMWAVQNNIVSGYDNGMFGVGDNITREQVAVILLKYAAYKGYDTSNRADLEELREAYLDVDDIHDWAADSMCWAVKNGVMKGTAGGKLMPLGNASRAEAATMLLNMLSAYGE